VNGKIFSGKMMRPVAWLLLAVLCACGKGESGPDDGGFSDADPDASDGACEIPAETNAVEDCNFDPDVSFDVLTGTTLQLESADGDMCVRIERRDDSPVPDGSALLWTPVEVWIGCPGSVAHVDTPEDLCWKVSHHNWFDAARVWTGTNRYDLSFTTTGGHGGDTTYLLAVFEEGPLDPGDIYCLEDGTVPRCDPIELFPVKP
jgi:hypothetical protein